MRLLGTLRLDRFQLVMDVIERLPGLFSRAEHVHKVIRDKLLDHRRHVTARGGAIAMMTEWLWYS